MNTASFKRNDAQAGKVGYYNTAIKVTDGNIEVISEGQWKLFTPGKTTNR